MSKETTIIARRGFIGGLLGLVAAPAVITKPGVLMQIRGELLDPWVLAAPIFPRTADSSAKFGWPNPLYETRLYKNLPRDYWKNLAATTDYKIVRRSKTEGQFEGDLIFSPGAAVSSIVMSEWAERYCARQNRSEEGDWTR